MHLFLYGTLMTGEPGHRELGLEKRLALIGRDRIAGTLYHLGDYPGLVPGGAGFVHGELFATLDAGLLAELDAFELFDPSNPPASEYIRMPVMALDSGYRSWVYAYNQAVGGAAVITSGSWHMR